MLSVIWNKKRDSFLGSCKGSDHDQGLRFILTKLAIGNSNVVLKPIFLHNHIVNSNSPFACNEEDDDSNSYCYLKSCHLCHKPLSPDKEIYMYRGDLGFCSVECRERQIYLDETKEIEISTQKILASFRQHRREGGGGRCETSRLLEEFRERCYPFSSQENGVVFSYS